MTGRRRNKQGRFTSAAGTFYVFSPASLPDPITAPSRQDAIEQAVKQLGIEAGKLAWVPTAAVSFVDVSRGDAPLNITDA